MIEPRYVVRQDHDPDLSEVDTHTDECWLVIDMEDQAPVSDWFTEEEALVEARRLNDAEEIEREEAV